MKSTITDFLSTNPAKTIGEVTIACFGLSFKANIDDLRESPALEITKDLAMLNICTILAVEPNISILPSSLSGMVDLVSVSEALNHSDICLLLVDHAEFKLVSKSDLENVAIIDTKGIWT